MNPYPARPPAADRSPDQDAGACGLLTALAAAPPGTPQRATLRDAAIKAWLPMAHRLARRYATRGEGLDDLVQIATVGLIKAVDRFDADRGVDFVNFAVPTILGELRRHFRDHTWAVRVPRRLQEMRIAINDANAVLTQTLGRAPTVADIAAHLHTSEEEVLEGLEGAQAYQATSLSTPVRHDAALQVGDTISADEHGYAVAELRLDLAPALARLTVRERRIVGLRFYGNQTQSQIAAQIGVSQMHVSRLLAAALAKLRTSLEC